MLAKIRFIADQGREERMNTAWCLGPTQAPRINGNWSGGTISNPLKCETVLRRYSKRFKELLRNYKNATVNDSDLTSVQDWVAGLVMRDFHQPKQLRRLTHRPLSLLSSISLSAYNTDLQDATTENMVVHGKFIANDLLLTVDSTACYQSSFKGIP